MSAAVKLSPLMTVEEFLKWPGDGTGRRYELVDGVLRAQDAASDAHGTIQSNISRQIGNHLIANRPNCRIVTTPGVEPRLRARWNYRVPDLGVTCTANRAEVHNTPEPILLVELLSPSNANDTWSNIPLYATLPSVQEILIIETTMIGAQILRRRPDGSWPKDPEPIEAGEAIQLHSIGLQITMGEVYRSTHLAPEAGS